MSSCCSILVLGGMLHERRGAHGVQGGVVSARPIPTRTAKKVFLRPILHTLNLYFQFISYFFRFWCNSGLLMYKRRAPVGADENLQQHIKHRFLSRETGGRRVREGN